MKKNIRRIRLALNSEQLRVISGGAGPAQANDMTSQLTNKSHCEGTRFCCKPPIVGTTP